MASGVRRTWVQILTLPFSVSTVLVKSLHYSEPQFPHLENENNIPSVEGRWRVRCHSTDENARHIADAK